VVGACEHGSKSSGPIKCCKTLVQLSNCWVVKNSDLWSYFIYYRASNWPHFNSGSKVETTENNYCKTMEQYTGKECKCIHDSDILVAYITDSASVTNVKLYRTPLKCGIRYEFNVECKKK
jgi:hypothetical protein